MLAAAADNSNTPSTSKISRAAVPASRSDQGKDKPSRPAQAQNQGISAYMLKQPAGTVPISQAAPPTLGAKANGFVLAGMTKKKPAM